MPGADYQLTELLGLRLSMNRFMMYNLRCYGGIRLPKDIAENKKGTHVLLVCSELNTLFTFHGSSYTHLNSLVGQAIFGNRAVAVIIGAYPDPIVERPIFQLVSAAQTFMPDSKYAINGYLREMGLTFHLYKDVLEIISKNIEKCLMEAFAPVGINDGKSIFWVVRPGGPAILDRVEDKLWLNEEKLWFTWHMLSEYGNMSGLSVLFVSDEVRMRSNEEGKNTIGDGFEWGVLFGFRSSFTVENVVLHNVPLEA